MSGIRCCIHSLFDTYSGAHISLICAHLSTQNGVCRKTCARKHNTIGSVSCSQTNERCVLLVMRRVEFRSSNVLTFEHRQIGHESDILVHVLAIVNRTLQRLMQCQRIVWIMQPIARSARTNTDTTAANATPNAAAIAAAAGRTNTDTDTTNATATKSYTDTATAATTDAAATARRNANRTAIVAASIRIRKAMGQLSLRTRKNKWCLVLWTAKQRCIVMCFQSSIPTKFSHNIEWYKEI